MPEDTKSLSEGVFNRDEFLSQADIAGEEILSQYETVLEGFEGGLLFYYFGNVDQTSHMLWRAMDPDHPAYDPDDDPQYADVIPGLYARLDAVVGHTLDRIDANTTLIVMSDHGFTSWRRTFHLNAWLRENGYLEARDPDLEDDPGFFANVDWSRTRAYGLGLNGLYINLKGREKNGIVDAGEREALMEEIAQRLLETVDPLTGGPAVTKVYPREETYQDGGAREIGPDLQVGYAKGTRGDGDSGLGEVVGEVLTDNTDEWSGDHCMDHVAVPGILATNRPLQRPASRLKDLAAAVLAEFGIEEFPPPA
jgi:predicted AlkP superfamily phosphohydrolase/phosphomutase